MEHASELSDAYERRGLRLPGLKGCHTASVFEEAEVSAQQVACALWVV
jgi:hypothetical protein